MHPLPIRAHCLGAITPTWGIPQLMRGYPVSLISIALAFAAKNFGIETTLKRTLFIVGTILNLLYPPVFTVTRAFAAAQLKVFYLKSKRLLGSLLVIKFKNLSDTFLQEVKTSF